MSEKQNPNDSNAFNGNFSPQDDAEANELLRDFFTSKEMLDPNEGYKKPLPELLFVDPLEEEADELLRDFSIMTAQSSTPRQASPCLNQTTASPTTPQRRLHHLTIGQTRHLLTSQTDRRATP